MEAHALQGFIWLYFCPWQWSSLNQRSPNQMRSVCGHLDKAKSLFDSLPSKGLQPNVKTYTMMIQAYCHEGLLNDANELFLEMEANGCLPNDVTYNTLIRGYFQNKKYHEAGVLIDEMLAHRVSPDASTTSLLLVLLESKEQDQDILALHKRFFP